MEESHQGGLESHYWALEEKENSLFGAQLACWWENTLLVPLGFKTANYVMLFSKRNLNPPEVPFSLKECSYSTAEFI